MMRKYHRWLVVFSGIIMLWIGATGFIGQALSLIQHGFGEDHDGPPPGAHPDAGEHHGPGLGAHHGPPHDWYHFIIDLHSGNFFGPFGKIVSVLMGAVLIFFCISGMWMYIDMFRRRRKASKAGLFWK